VHEVRLRGTAHKAPAVARHCQYSRTVPYEPIIPPGQRLGTSHDVDGAVTGHLFEDGTRGIRGNAAWRWVDVPQPNCSSGCECEHSRELTPEERELVIQLALVVLDGLVSAVSAAAPHVRRWWNEKTVPAVVSVWKRTTKSRNVRPRAAATASSVPSHVVASAEVEVEDAEPELSMSSAEWAQRFRAMLAAGAFQAEQQRILFNARIEDDDAAIAGAGVANQLTPGQFAERIAMMLAANPSLLGRDTASELMRVFSQGLDGRHTPTLEQ
jgi:hypothetical protein